MPVERLWVERWLVEKWWVERWLVGDGCDFEMKRGGLESGFARSLGAEIRAGA